jgi:hypothetical protein
MAMTVLENGWISDDFEIGTEPLILKDAIVMPADQYNALSADEISALKQQRYDNWIAIINAPPQE